MHDLHPKFFKTHVPTEHRPHKRLQELDDSVSSGLAGPSSRCCCWLLVSKHVNRQVVAWTEYAFQGNTYKLPQPSPPTHGSQSADDSHEKVKGRKNINQVYFRIGDGLRADPCVYGSGLCEMRGTS